MTASSRLMLNAFADNAQTIQVSDSKSLYIRVIISGVNLYQF